MCDTGHAFWRVLGGPYMTCGLLLAVTVGGCASERRTTRTTPPPATWVQPSVPLAAAPVEYEHRLSAPAPTVAAEMSAPSPVPGPAPFLAPPADLPPGPQPLPFPPPLPPAEAEASAAPPPALPDLEPPAVTQAMLDELRGQVELLDRRVQDQAAALEGARRQSAEAQQSVQRLSAELSVWRSELEQVQSALREQNASELRALDELNRMLEEWLGGSRLAEPPPAPGSSGMPQTAGGRLERGVAR